MIRITKNERRFLKAVTNSHSDWQDNHYSVKRIADELSFDYGYALLLVDDLVSKGLAIRQYPDTSPDDFSLTFMGISYNEYRRDVILTVFLSSVVCPIVVTIMTEVLIHGSVWLLRMLLLQG
ncbi:hypothetical protein ACTNEN_09590 [Oribacterium sp. HCP28S3_H8]|uniref:hypothetical protein n=1 Tax=Oribacterium sp. HCP28S3_H8 TaxID=3438945 RepID=UPI003F894051